MKIAVHISNTEWYTLQAQGMIVLVPKPEPHQGNDAFVCVDISGNYRQFVHPKAKSPATAILPVVVDA